MDQALNAQANTLGLRMRDRLTSPQRAWLSELIEVNELGLALEVLADWLSEDGSSVSPAERDEFLRLSTIMGNTDRVMTPLALCPVV